MTAVWNDPAVDWSAFAPAFTAARPSPLLDGVPEVRAAVAEPVAPVQAAGPIDGLTDLPEAERGHLLLDLSGPIRPRSSARAAVSRRTVPSANSASTP